MMNRIFLAAMALAIAIAPRGAQAETTLWKQVGSWDVSFYPESEGCSAYVSFNGGVEFFIGLDGRNNTIDLEILIFHPSWRSIEKGKQYSVTVAFGDESPWTLEMLGRQSGSEIFGLGIYLPAGSEEAGNLVDEFMREVDMDWSYNNVSLGKLALRGSRAAFETMIECTTSYRDAIGSSDPFGAGAAPTPTDPFQ